MGGNNNLKGCPKCGADLLHEAPAILRPGPGPETYEDDKNFACETARMSGDFIRSEICYENEIAKLKEHRDTLLRGSFELCERVQNCEERLAKAERQLQKLKDLNEI
jgi:hypothetical protein